MSGSSSLIAAISAGETAAARQKAASPWQQQQRSIMAQRRGVFSASKRIASGWRKTQAAA